MKKLRKFVIIIVLLIAAFLGYEVKKIDLSSGSDLLSQVIEWIPSEDTADQGAIDLSNIPEYNGEPYIAVNGNVPFFEDTEVTATSFEEYSDLDNLGRCGVAMAAVGKTSCQPKNVAVSVKLSPQDGIQSSMTV